MRFVISNHSVLQMCSRSRKFGKIELPILPMRRQQAQHEVALFFAHIHSTCLHVCPFACEVPHESRASQAPSYLPGSPAFIWRNVAITNGNAVRTLLDVDRTGDHKTEPIQRSIALATFFFADFCACTAGSRACRLIHGLARWLLSLVSEPPAKNLMAILRVGQLRERHLQQQASVGEQRCQRQACKSLLNQARSFSSPSGSSHTALSNSRDTMYSPADEHFLRCRDAARCPLACARSPFAELDPASRALLLSQGGSGASCAFIAAPHVQTLLCLTPDTASSSFANCGLDYGTVMLCCRCRGPTIASPGRAGCRRWRAAGRGLPLRGDFLWHSARRRP